MKEGVGGKISRINENQQVSFTTIFTKTCPEKKKNTPKQTLLNVYHSDSYGILAQSMCDDFRWCLQESVSLQRFIHQSAGTGSFWLAGAQRVHLFPAPLGDIMLVA